MKMKDYCVDEMPRERLLDKGPGSLSDVELLAVLLHSGTPDTNVLDLARILYKEAGGSLGGVGAMSVEKMRELDGIGPAKSAVLASAFEIGRRLAEEKVLSSGVPMSSPKAVNALMSPSLSRLGHEECWVLYLNRRNVLLGRERITSGDDSSTIIDNKTIVRRALEMKSSGIILVHNHPAGNAMPSVADIGQTQGLKKALGICGISLVDHVIVGGDTYYSFADEELVTGAGKKACKC